MAAPEAGQSGDSSTVATAEAGAAPATLVRCQWEDCRFRSCNHFEVWAHVDMAHFSRCLWYSCNEMFESEYEFKSHVYKHTLTLCYLCDKPLAESLLEHMASVHDMSNDDDVYNSYRFQMTDDIPPKTSCLWENCASENVKDMWTHLLKRHVSPVDPCSWAKCGFIAEHKLAMKRHVYGHVSNSFTSCFVCSAEFEMEDQIEEHLMTHHEGYYVQYCEPRYKVDVTVSLGDGEAPMPPSPRKPVKIYIESLYAKQATTQSAEQPASSSGTTQGESPQKQESQGTGSPKRVEEMETSTQTERSQGEASIDPQTGSSASGTEPQSGSSASGTEPQSGSSASGAEPQSGGSASGTDLQSGSSASGTEPQSGSSASGTNTQLGTDPQSGSSASGIELQSGSSAFGTNTQSGTDPTSGTDPRSGSSASGTEPQYGSSASGTEPQSGSSASGT